MHQNKRIGSSLGEESDGTQKADTSKTSVKNEPVFAVERTHQRECFRSGEPNFTMDRVKNCKAASYKCKFCKLVGQMTICNEKIPQRHKEMMQRFKARIIICAGLTTSTLKTQEKTIPIKKSN